jgi:hypothetical protein
MAACLGVKSRGIMGKAATNKGMVAGRLRGAARKLVLTACLACAFASGVVAADTPSEGLAAPERRRDQYPTGFGYGAFPYPYKLPGIGSGLSFAAGAFNIADTYTDVYGIAFTGDVKGGAVGVGDLHLIPRRLIVDLGYSAVNKASFQSYAQRGMHTDKDEYRLIEVGDTAFYGARVTATFLERRFEMYGAWYRGASRLKSIRDKDGNLIIEAQDPPREGGRTTLLGTRLDLTDDYADPRRGIRLDVTRTQSPSRGSGSNYYVMDYNVTGYVPFAPRSTLAINLLRSDAFVLSRGETDPAALQAQAGLNCASIADPTQQQFCNDVIANSIANNKFGTATSLGGFSRLRSYPQGRYQGAHSMFLGAEFRWNVTEERRPFDIFIMKDVRTTFQVAFFYETGVTSDSRGELTWGNMRSSYGTGVRMVFASGLVLRADVAAGREGVSPAIFIGYPWEI